MVSSTPQRATLKAGPKGLRPVGSLPQFNSPNTPSPPSTPYRVHTSQSQLSFRILNANILREMSNPILIHAEQFQGKTFGDPRLLKRGQHYTKH